ncbi:MAG: hypothetical protein LBC20_10850 [Planctomycetaceae bacterium]|jgi:methionyl-tRNA formyltransferase|nr:hypothetical protein [Planctomycetaceae bacterium]
MTFRIGIIIGSSRLFGGARDLALDIVDSILQSPHQLAVVFAESNDPVLTYSLLHQHGIPTYSLPHTFCGTHNEICQKMTEPRFAEDFNYLTNIPFDLGISFYTNWLPPIVIGYSRLGFINLHPSPLPMLTGYEAERFHVLMNHRKSWGTIHYLAEKFDTGNILARGNMVELPENMTPMTVYEQLIGNCIPVLRRILDDFASGKPMHGEPQDESQRTYATYRDAIRESVVQWSTDSNLKLDCRFRAYCTANDGMILRAAIEGQLCNISNIILLPNNNNIVNCIPNNLVSPGQKIGEYQQSGSFYNAPIIKTLEGIAVVAVNRESS